MHRSYIEYNSQASIPEHQQQYHVFRMLRYLEAWFRLPFQQMRIQEVHRLFVH